MYDEAQPIIPPEDTVHFDLQTWEANQTVLSRDGSIYETNMTNYPEYDDSGLTWGLKPNVASMSMTENVTFPPAGSSFKLELVWKDYGKEDGTSSYGFTFHSSGVLGFLFQKSGIKVAMFLREGDGSTILFKPINGATYNDTPLSITYKQVFTYDADTRGYVFEHFEGADLTTADLSESGVIPVEDGDWGYGPNTEYEIKNNGNQEYIKITVTSPPLPGSGPPPPTPPLIPTLHWDFETFYDNQNAVEFTNYNVDIVDEKAVMDASTDLLLAFIPSALVSKFSISLIFNFKALNSGDPINFIFSTYTGIS
jgi:hypothetical protein